MSDYLSIDYSNLKDFQLSILQYTKKKVMKMYVFGIYFLHWLEIEKIEKTLTKISKSELSIEKNNKNQTRNLIFLTLVSILFVSYVRNFNKID